MNGYTGVTLNIREIKRRREVRAKTIVLMEAAKEAEEASSMALRAAEAAIHAEEYETAEELMDDSARHSCEAGELRRQASMLGGGK